MQKLKRDDSLNQADLNKKVDTLQGKIEDEVSCSGISGVQTESVVEANYDTEGRVTGV